MKLIIVTNLLLVHKIYKALNAVIMLSVNDINSIDQNKTYKVRD